MISPRFRIGDRVRIDDRKERKHHRVPAYVKGCVGVIERVCQPHGRPELLAYGDRGARPTPVYRVRIPQRRIWSDYAGRPEDTLEIEIFEHWLSLAAQPIENKKRGGGRDAS
jgi:nitrile hydratase